MCKLKKLWYSFPRLIFVSGGSYVALKNMRKELSRRLPKVSLADIVYVALAALAERIDALEDEK